MKRQKLMPTILFILFLMLILGFVFQLAQAGDDEWTTTSLAGFGVNYVAVEPTNPNVMYAATDRGLLLSWDAGQTWRALPVGTGRAQVQAVLVHPEDAAQLYAAFDDRLQKSTDGGQTWSALGEGVVDSPYWIGMPPGQPDVIYVMTRAGLFRSKDAGGSWSSAGIPVSGQVQGLAFHPDDPNVVFVLTNNGRSLFHTNDGGQSWTQVSDELNNATALAMTPGGKLFLQDRNSVQRSEDNGQSWQQVNPEEVRYFTEGTLAVDGNESNTIYIASNEGIYRSEDEGTSWTALPQTFSGWAQKIVADPTTPKRLFILDDGQLSISTDGGATWGSLGGGTNATIIQAHPALPNTLFSYRSGNGNIWRSQDGGQSWQLSNDGLENVSITTLAFDPTDANMIYAGSGSGLYRSQDNGDSWSMTGLPNNVRVLSIVVDPQNSANLFVGGENDLLHSTNSGESWTAVPVGRYITDLAIDPENPQVMYALVNEQPHRSVDGGMTWVSLNYPGYGATSLVVKPDDAAILYVGGYNGLYISRDGSALEPLALQLVVEDGYYYQNSLLLLTDPQRPDALYLALGSDLYISPDTGMNWYPLQKGAPTLSFASLAVDAGDPLTFYAVFEGGTGDVWQYRLSQLPEPPTPIPTMTATTTPTPFPTRTPPAQTTETAVSGLNRLSATATVLANPDNKETDATAVAVFGLDNSETSPGNTSPPNTLDTETPVGGSNWMLILGGTLLLIAALGGGFYWWQQQQGTTAVASPSKTICTNCGAELPTQAKFCIKCGQSQ